MKTRLIVFLSVIFLSSMAAMAAPTSLKVSPKLAGVPMDDAPEYNPEGVEKSYIMNVTEYGGLFGEENQVGYKMTIRFSEDGKTVWFRDLNPGFNRYSDDEEYTWIKGTIEGSDITVKAGQVLYVNEMFGKKLYFEVVTVNAYGQVNDFLDEIHFTLSDDKITQTDNSNYVAVYEDGETMDDAGIFMFFYNYAMEPISDIYKAVPPEDAEVEQWLMTSTSGARFVNVARSGNDVYIAGLSEMAPDDYVTGVIENNVLTIKSGYILTSNPRYYIRLMAAEEGEPDETGFPTFNILMQYSFDVAEDGKKFTMTPSDLYLVEANYNMSSLFSGVQDVKLFPYAGDKPAVPANPVVVYDELNDYLMVTIPSEDTEGNYINSEKITYRVLFDGVPYEFSPDSYFGLSESMTDIPYSFTDYYDIYVNGNVHTIYLHDVPAWEVVSVESTYTVDGVSNTSKGEFSGITSIEDSAKLPVSETMTDLLGRVVKNPSAGSMVIVSTRYSDGSVKTSKRIVR